MRGLISIVIMPSLRRGRSSYWRELWRLLRLACCSHLMLCLTSRVVVSASDRQVEVSYLRKQRRQSLLQASNQHHDILLLQDILVKSTSRNLQANGSSLQKCHDTLDSISQQKQEQQQPQSGLTRSDFVTFVHMLGDSGMSTAMTSFSDLPAVWIMIFYAAACSSGQDCVDEPPSVSLDRTGVSGALLEFFCQQALSSATTIAVLKFEYVLRYDETYMKTAAVTEQDIAQCLETAAKHLLFDQVAQCSFTNKGSSRQRERRLTDRLRTVEHVDTRLLQDEEEDESASGKSSDSSTPTNCPYTVDVNDTRLNDFCTLPRFPCLFVCYMNLQRLLTTHFLICS